MKNNKGITLVALIITVVIMLILAGVAIGSLTGDGLFSKTRDAAGAYENATRTESEQIQTLINEIDEYLTGGNGGEETDTTPPSTATIESSNVEETTFTLTATGADEESGIAKYEFYLNGILEKTIESAEGTITYNVSGKTAGTPYTCKVIVYDNAGNPKESSTITVTTKSAGTPIATVVKVGDYVNYDAGTWTEADFNKITSSDGKPTVNKSKNLPNTQGQFGGFTAGQSRNSNSTEYSNAAGWKPRTAGWRVWSIDKNTGEVTLISAGHPETYYHYNEKGNSTASVNILRKRDCSMYENSYAKAGSAHILTGQEAAEWYNKQFGTNYTIVENGENNSSTFCMKIFTTAEPISVLENGSFYWFASAHSSYTLYNVATNQRCVTTVGYACGMRCSPPNFSTIWSPSRTRNSNRRSKDMGHSRKLI